MSICKLVTLHGVVHFDKYNLKISAQFYFHFPLELALEAIKKVRNPFAMVNAEYVMRDLGLCRNKAYSLFRRADFPSVKIGKKHKVMFLAYVMWKMKKKGRIV